MDPPQKTLRLCCHISKLMYFLIRHKQCTSFVKKKVQSLGSFRNLQSWSTQSTMSPNSHSIEALTELIALLKFTICGVRTCFSKGSAGAAGLTHMQLRCWSVLCRMKYFCPMQKSFIASGPLQPTGKDIPKKKKH